ncbi:hypothetical protein [Apibacter adventoris]|uniref:Lipoprotein n=1 Tax=Apibacter adventoris TaxID=1679466 RepID=A0A2S8AF58_9FLAO|nr:hypothetical protein [Apibacter adventoris]PQL94279.1 hypothetical protein C4S77_03725 [Apibacter adventoris]
MKKLLFLFSFILIVSCNKKHNTTQNANTHQATDSLNNGSTKKLNSSKWEYSEEEDKMGSKNYYAIVKNPENLELEFPYNNSYAYLCIRNLDGQNSLIFSVTEGQIDHNLDGGSIKVRFDSEKPFTVNFTTSPDLSSNYIYLNNSDKLIEKLKTSKKMVIEVLFFQNGIRQIEFNTANLVWNH